MALILALLVGAAFALAIEASVPRMPALWRFLRSVEPGGDGVLPSGLPGRGRIYRIFYARRLARLRVQLPQALVTLSTSVRAGLSLPQAVAAAADGLPGPAGEEFRAVARDVSLGGTMEQALEAFERRVPLPEVRLMTAGLSLARATGGSLAPLLDTLAETLRERERLRGQVRALTAQGRLSGYVVGATPVVMLLVMWLIDPAFVAPVFTTPLGYGMLAAAAVLEALGAVGIRAVVRIEP